MNTPLENEIKKRFGILPNFFCLASADPAIATNLWGFAQFAYLDNPLPSLFKERLFVYLSRFCEVRYCIARHVGFLAGLGHPAGDSSCLPQSVEAILPLLRRPLPVGEGLLPHLAGCAGLDAPLSFFPEPDSAGEQALFACATHVFLQSPDAARAHEALRRALGPLSLERLNLVLAFVRTAHYWTKLHPELVLEDDISHLLAAHETLAQCILKDPEAQKDSLARQVAAELTSLRKLRQQHESISQAYQELSVDHQYVKHSLLRGRRKTCANSSPANALPGSVRVTGTAPLPITTHKPSRFGAARRTWMIRPGPFWIRGGYMRQTGLVWHPRIRG